jgi:hypothetical protein
MKRKIKASVCFLGLPFLCFGVVAPEALKAWPLSDRQIRLEWSDVNTEELGYRIQRATTRDGVWEDLAETLPVDAHFTIDTGLEPGTLYFYRVGAIGQGSTIFSAPAKAWTDSQPFGERSVSFQNGYGGYSGTVSVGLDQTRPEQSLQSAILWVDNNDPTDQRQVLLKFEEIFGARPHQVPEQSEIIAASLRLYLGTSTNVQSNKPIDFHQMQVEWQPSVRWDDPILGGDGVQKDDLEARSEPDAIRIFNITDHFFEVDVTASLRAWASGEIPEGWAILTNWSDGFGFHTELQTVFSLRPELIVTFDSDPENTQPAVVGELSPINGAVNVPEPASVFADFFDSEGDSLSVTLYGRKAAVAADDFKVILIPDTQFYAAEINGGTRHIFFSQTDWIVQNHEAKQIAFALHMGDISQSGDIKANASNSLEWSIAAQAMYRLHNPVATGLPEGVPYAVSVGNHDQEPMWRSSGSTDLYNQYFGVSHLSKYSYYGGHYGNNNDNYYSLFEKGSYKFLVISMEYWDPARDPIDTELLEWADGLLKEYSDHIGIVVSHHMVNPGNPGTWSPYGEVLYEVLKDNANLRLMLGGHVTGEGIRVNEYNGRTVYALLQDYQGMEFGGSGFLRILNFSPKRNELNVSTYSPWLDEETNQFGGSLSLPFNLGTNIPTFEELIHLEGLSNRTSFAFDWDLLLADTEYEWYLEVSDGRKTFKSEMQSFRTVPNTYTSWQKLNFSENTAASGRDADPDGDGRTNLNEFLFGGNPLLADSQEFSISAVGNQINLVYHRRSGTGMVWACEYSHDLEQWWAVPNSVLTDNTVRRLQEQMESVRLELLWEPTQSSQFWRLNPRQPD